MAEVEAEDVDPGLNQFTDVVDPVDGRTQRGEDFDLFIRLHDEDSRVSGWRESR
ncbi:hypothetical protein D3C73_1628010 [compost metagenome]